MAESISVRSQSLLKAVPAQLASRALHLALLLSLTGAALSVVYLVGLEPMPYLHNAFHDLRHGTGFPCH